MNDKLMECRVKIAEICNTLDKTMLSALASEQMDKDTVDNLVEWLSLAQQSLYSASRHIDNTYESIRQTGKA
jgi:hypothetical protein